MKNYFRISCALAAGLAVGQGRMAMAGWTGQMNGAGTGKAAVNVTTTAGTAANAPTAIVSLPSATIPPVPPPTTFKASAALPANSSASTVARIEGSAGYVWRATTIATGGDKTDNLEITSRTVIIPTRYATITADSTAFIDETGKAGLIRVNAFATGGAAMLLRGYEYFGEGEPESLEDLKANGVVKWEILMAGPFDLVDGEGEGCKAINIPFTVEQNVDKLYFVTDGVAISTPNEPPVPSATKVPPLLASGAIIQLAANDDYTATPNINLYITDAATPGFKAGPFKAGNKIFLQKNPSQPAISLPSTSVTALVRTKGQATLIAEDDQGAVSNPGVAVP